MKQRKGTCSWCLVARLDQAHDIEPETPGGQPLGARHPRRTSCIRKRPSAQGGIPTGSPAGSPSASRGAPGQTAGPKRPHSPAPPPPPSIVLMIFAEFIAEEALQRSARRNLQRHVAVWRLPPCLSKVPRRTFGNGTSHGTADGSTDCAWGCACRGPLARPLRSVPAAPASAKQCAGTTNGAFCKCHYCVCLET